MHTITESDTGALPATLIVAGHITWSGVVLAAVEFTDTDNGGEDPMVRLEYVDNVEEHEADALVMVLGTVALPLLHMIQDVAR